MSDKKIKAMIANNFLEVADALETGQYGKKPDIGFASEGSEHGQDNIEAVSYTHLYRTKGQPGPHRVLQCFQVRQI